MASAIGHLLPLAVALAFSSLPIIAAILILLSPRTPVVSVFYLIGLAAGIFAVLLGLSLSVSVLPRSESSHPEIWQAVGEMLLGIGLTAWAVVSWWRSRRADTEPTLPRWMSVLNRLNVFTAATVGFAFALRPKNLLLSVAAAVVVGTSGLSSAGTLVAIAIFTVLAVSTVAAPVIGFLIYGRRMERALENTRTWIVRNNHTVTSVVLLLTGVVIFGAGLARL